MNRINLTEFTRTLAVLLALLLMAGTTLANEQANELDVDEVVEEQASATGEEGAAGSPEVSEPSETAAEAPAAESTETSEDGSASSINPSTSPTPAMPADGTPEAAPAATAEPEATDPEEPVSEDSDETLAWGPLDLFEKTIHPGEKRRITWYPDQSALGLSVPTPVLVARGDREGPALCLTAAIHGDELNGVEMIRRLLLDVDPEELRGTIIGIPIVNTFGFIRSSRYLPDRRDLNRYFPGSSGGSSASRLAAALFGELKANCDLLVDIHTGSFHRTNLPQLRADLSVPEVVEFTHDFGATPVLRSRAPRGSLRQAAVNAGIPTVTFEAGEPLRFQPEEVAHGVKALESLLRNREMVSRFSLWNAPQPVFYESSWVRSDGGGILLTRVDLGDIVEEDDLLATVTDPINNTVQELRAPFAGRVLGMALNQVVLPGFAAIHLGRATSEQEAVSSAQSSEPDDEHEDEGLDPEDPDAPGTDSDEEAAENEGIEDAAADRATTATSTDGTADGTQANSSDSESVELSDSATDSGDDITAKARGEDATPVEADTTEPDGPDTPER